jgi:hypothetical protein
MRFEVSCRARLSATMPAPGKAWAVGFYESGSFAQNTLIEHFSGGIWSVVPSPNPSNTQNLLYGCRGDL